LRINEKGNTLFSPYLNPYFFQHLHQAEPPNLIHLQEVQNMNDTDSDQNLEQHDEEYANSDTEYTQSDETLDMAILQELIRDEGSLLTL